MKVETIQTSEKFTQLRVTYAAETVVVDLVADPVAVIEAPVLFRDGEAEFQVDSRHEIFVNKLCSLIGRNEWRDLEDLR